MHLSTHLLPVALLLLPMISALPADTPKAPNYHSLLKRGYSGAFLSRLNTIYRGTRLAAPMCNGPDCPIMIAEEKMCSDMRYHHREDIRFPRDSHELDSQGRNSTDAKWEEYRDIELCLWFPPIDERCAQFGIERESIYGLSLVNVELQVKEFGFAGCPATPEQLVSRIMIESGWDEKTVREKLDFVAPGWEQPEQETEKLVRVKGLTYVDDRWNPFHLPTETTVRVLPNGPVQDSVTGCAAWEMARRGENCSRFSKRVGLTREKFLEINDFLVKKTEGDEEKVRCKLLAGYSYCVDSSAY
ncbi:hypothetical protein BJ508DRAFT_413855 [Ascobolus immersus RN42]|uniref:LysM domain-containing protein n=1 Tax=Ascobolus immersus RN42 TaxID=1160509 RepID=A0A3N4IC03_ASCIM|nr:hypothetical protein BJ508DRAFT_413855 [Ascobolus immersus RN42]